MLPILNAIDPAVRAPQVLILAPTRELATQIRDEVYTLSKYMRILSVAAVGGTSKRKQIEILRK
ncbi:MAG: DEAD/DEAH box helicase [Candidatus Peribacteria bacterium]|nr:MAG: DEAD/DEAH box helicase [Candidatus Peribacteria bacterium]